MDTEKYLQRINFTGKRGVDLSTLCNLAIAHLHAVPFENLDIHFRTKMPLDPESLFDKIVIRRRGGYCFELNALFGTLLRELGFTVSFIAANVFGQNTEGRAFDHLTLSVTFEDGPYLVDVGFGDGFHEPMVLRANEQSEFGQRTFHVAKCAEIYRLECRKEGELAKGLSFELKPRIICEFTHMHKFHSSNPASWWTQELVASKATVDGRIALVGRRYTRRSGTEIDVRELTDKEYIETLDKEFDIQIPYIPRPRASSFLMRIRRLFQIVLSKFRRLLPS